MLIKRVMGGRIVASPAEVASVTHPELPEHVEHTAVQHSRPNPSVEPKSMPTDLVGDEGQPNTGTTTATKKNGKKVKKASKKRKTKRSTKKTVKKAGEVKKKQSETKEVEEAKESVSLPKEAGGYAVVPHHPSHPPEEELPEGVETEDVEEAPVTSERTVPEIPQTHTTVHEEEVNVEERVEELKSGKEPKQFMTRASEASQAVKELLKEAGEKASKGESLKEALAEVGKEHVKELRQEKLKQVEEGEENESMPSAMPKKPAELGLVSGSKKTEIVSKPAESRPHATGKKIGVTHFVVLVNNKVKKRIANEIKDYIRKLPPYIRAKIRASDYISALDMAKTANDVKKVIEMLNNDVRYLYLQHAKKEVLKNIASLPVTLKEILVAQHVYGDIKNRVRNAKSIEGLNEAIKEINDEIRDAVARVNVHLGRWYDNWFNGIMAKLQEYKSIQLFNEAKKDVLKQLESLPESVKEQMGGKLEEIEKKVKGAKNAEELNEAVKEANEALQEAQENVQVAEFKYLRWMGSHLGTESKLKEYASFEDAVNAVKKEIESLPEEVKQYIGAKDILKKLDNAKTYKDIVNIVNEVNRKIDEYNVVKGRQITFINKIMSRTNKWELFKELANYKPPRMVVRDYYKKLVDYLAQVDPDAMIQFTQEFKGKFRGKMTAERAKKLMEQMRQEAEKLALHAYKKKILSDLGDYEKKINASFYYPVYKVVKEYEEKVRNAKSLDELRKVVNQMNLKLKETAIINNIGLEGIKLPPIKDIAEGRLPGLVSEATLGGVGASEGLTPSQKALWLSNMGNEDLSTQIMGFWMSQPNITPLQSNIVSRSASFWKETHPTSLSGMIMQEAMKDKGLSAGAGAFLAGVIGSLEAPFLPETYVSMYKLATSQKYRSDVWDELMKLRKKRPELFWGNIIGQAVGVGLMAGLGKAVGSLEEPVLKVQEFKPIYTTIEGKLSPTEEVGSIKLKQIGFWRTKAKIPEAFEFEKATIKNIGLKGGTITKLIKEPTGIKEIKVIPVEGEVIRPSLARLISAGEEGEEELPSFARIFAEKGVASEKVAMTKLGEPLGKEVKFLDVTSFEEGGKPIVSIKGGEVASIKGLKSKLFGGKVAKLMELEYSPTEDITMMLKGEASRYPLKLGKVEIELLGRKGIPKEVLEEVKGSKPSTFERIRNVLAETKRSVTEKVEGAVKGETEIPVQFEESPEESVSLYEWLYGGKKGEEVEPAKGVAGERYGGEGVTKEAAGGKGGQKLQLLLKEKGREAVKNMAKEMKMYRIVEEGGGMKPSAVMITLAPLADIGELPNQFFKSNQLLRAMSPESMRFTLPEMEVGKSLKEISGITVSQLPEFMVKREIGAGMGAGMMGGLRLGQPQFGRLRLFLPAMIAEGYGQRLMPLPVTYEGEVPKAMSMMMGVPMESGEMRMGEETFINPRIRYESVESPSTFTPTLTSPQPPSVIKANKEETPSEITSPNENIEPISAPSEELNFVSIEGEGEIQAPKLSPFQIPNLTPPPQIIPPNIKGSKIWRPRFWFAYGFPMYWGYRRRLPNRYLREVLII